MSPAMFKNSLGKLTKNFPQIEIDILSQFLTHAKKISNKNPTLIMKKILWWCKKLEIEINHLQANDFIRFHAATESRLKQLKLNNKHLKGVDLSLFQIYCSDEIATKEYKKYVASKTKNMRNHVIDNPKVLTGSTLKYQISKHGIEEGTLRYEIFIKNKKLASPRCIDYWISQGFTIDAAKIKVSESQVKFSLDLCIEKYGYDQGVAIWQDRQDRWQETLNNKSEDEIKALNEKKKVFRPKSKYGFIITDKNKNTPTNLYYLKFTDIITEEIFYKIGITKHDDIQKRFRPNHVIQKNSGLKYEIVF